MVQNTHDVRDRNPHSPEPIAKDLSTDIITVPDVELGSARSPPPPPTLAVWAKRPQRWSPRGPLPAGSRWIPRRPKYGDPRFASPHW